MIIAVIKGKWMDMSINAQLYLHSIQILSFRIKYKTFSWLRSYEFGTWDILYSISMRMSEAV